jgi:lipopolysaccharide transport system ATP-binding protein
VACDFTSLGVGMITPRNVLPPEDGGASIRVDNLGKTFALAEQGTGPVSLRHALRAGKRDISVREIEALSDVSFSVKQGERIGIIGRNGAGKTTLLSMLAGITDATEGSIAIKGDVHAMLTIGAVLRDEATGRENIYLDGAIYGRSRDAIDAYAEDVIAFAELGEFIDRPVRTYSSGMKARLAFSMGVVVQPDILIIDETLAVGDVFFAAKAGIRMKEVAQRGRIVILVSHSLGAIVDMCDRCLWLDKGRLVMDGPALEVTRAYERAVEQADEAELSAKFGAGDLVSKRADTGALSAIRLEQQGAEPGPSARAFVPLTLTIEGVIKAPAGNPDLILSILRVDGRLILQERLSSQGGALPVSGAFTASVTFEPMLLAAGLYRIDVALADNDGVAGSLSRVIEILDEEGQFGGVPMLYHPPLISAERTDRTTQ